MTEGAGRHRPCGLMSAPGERADPFGSVMATGDGSPGAPTDGVSNPRPAEGERGPHARQGSERRKKRLGAGYHATGWTREL